MYTKTTAACGSLHMAHSTLPQNFWTTLAFSFSLLDFRLKYPSKSSLELHPLVCCGLLTSDVSIKSVDIAQKEEWKRHCGTSTKPLLNSDHSQQHHSFFFFFFLVTSDKCSLKLQLLFPQWNKCLKISNREVTDILSSNDWQASGHIVTWTFQQSLSTDHSRVWAQGAFLWLYRFLPQFNTPWQCQCLGMIKLPEPEGFQ